MDSSKNGNGKLYRSVKVSRLENRRRGKHRELTEGIVRELKMLKEGSALEVPLASAGGLAVANLRSAVHRAAMAAKMEIQTQSDDNNLYIWVTAVSERNGKAEKNARR